MKLPILQKINHHCYHLLSFSSSGPSTKLVTCCHWYVREEDRVDGQLEKKKTNKFLPNQTKLKLQLLFLLLLNKPTLQRLGLILASVSCPAIKDWFQKLFFFANISKNMWWWNWNWSNFHIFPTLYRLCKIWGIHSSWNVQRITFRGRTHIHFPRSFYIGHLYNIFILYSYYIHIIYYIYS